MKKKQKIKKTKFKAGNLLITQLKKQDLKNILHRYKVFKIVP